MRFFLLGGGRGTRFQPLTLVMNKCLIPVAGKPAARWIVEDIMAQGFNDLVMCINRKDEQAFKYEFRDLTNIKYSISEEPLGTVGELLVAKNLIDDTFALRYLDDLTEINYKKLIDFHKKKHAVVTIAVTRKMRLPVGVVNLDDEGKITSFSEKPLLDKYVWTAIALLEPKAVAYFKFGEDIAAHALPKMLEVGEPVYAYINDEPWFDVGNIEHWKNADAYFRKNRG